MRAHQSSKVRGPASAQPFHGVRPEPDGVGAHEGEAALTCSRLSHVDRNYVRADTIAGANAALISDEDVVRLSPLKDRHINSLGRYLFNIRASGPGQGLRPSGTRTPPRTTRTDGQHTRPTRPLVAPRGGLPPDLL
ncbi:hypothetical protein ABT040_23305 [Streptomyces sp. NPDC002688]|uniref:hypothetical protein n=1 Tax=Streptomyces sp. NPDC002688 TaxID=3154423 RepID=UPI00331B86C5